MSLASQLNFLGTEFRVNSTTNSGQEQQYITALVGGGFVVVWQNNGSSSIDGHAIAAQIYDASGAPSGSEFEVSGNLAPPSDLERFPSVVALNNGGFAVTWESSHDTNSLTTAFRGIFGRTFAADGTPVSAEFQVPTQVAVSGLNLQSFPVSTALEDGSFVVIWQSSHEFVGAQIYSQRYNETGTPQGGVRLIPEFNNATVAPDIAALSDGGYVVTWQTFTPGNSQGISMRQFNAQGIAVAGEVFVNTTTDGDQNAPRVVGLDNGGWVVVWGSSSAGAPFFLEVRGQVYASNGAVVGSEFSFYPEGDFGANSPVVTALPNGGFVVAAHMINPDSRSTDIFARAFDDTGMSLGEIELVNTGTHSLGTQLRPELTTLENGEIVVLWDGAGTDIALDVFGRILGSSSATSGDDLLFTGDAGLSVDGLGGDDTITGGNGNDSLIGGAGADTLFGGGGKDRLEGNAGNDHLLGGKGRDHILGGAGNDSISAGAKNDFIKGGNGNDTLGGGGGNDQLKGGGGNDKLAGGKGNDKMTGNGGADDFIFKNGFGNDRITDFNALNNREDINLRGVTQITGWNDLNNNHMAQVGLDVVITDGVNTLTLEGVDIADLGRGDFLF